MCMSTGNFHAQEKAGLVPPGVRVSANRTAWIVGELDAVLQARAAGWPDDQVRELVNGLVEARKSLAAGLAQYVRDVPVCEPPRTHPRPANLKRAKVAQ